MAVPYERVRVVMSGTIAAVQSWSFGLSVTPEAGPFGAAMTQANLDTWLQNRVVNFTDAISTAVSGGIPLRSTTSAQTLWSALTGYYIPANSDSASLMSEANFGAAVAGNSTTPAPAQTCVVASLRTTTPGRTGRGRIYLPGTGVAPGADYRLGNTLPVLLAKQVASLLTAINNSQLGGESVEVVVASTAGRRPVTRVEIDNRPDTQRRRADKLLSTLTGTSPVTNS